MRRNSIKGITGKGPSPPIDTIAETGVFPLYMQNKRVINRLNRTAPVREGLNDRPAYGKRLGDFQDPRQDRTFTDRIAARQAQLLASTDTTYLMRQSEDMVNAMNQNSSLSL